MLLRKKLDSPGLVGLHLGNFQRDSGTAGDLGIFRPHHFFQPSHIPIGNVRLLHKPKNIVHVLDDLPLAFGLGVASLANMNSVTVARKLFVRPFPLADLAMMSHPSLFPANNHPSTKFAFRICSHSPSAWRL